MDWLPGSFLPPHTPITTLYPAYANNIAKVPLKIPGRARTFVVYSGTVNFTFGSNYPVGELINFKLAIRLSHKLKQLHHNFFQI